MIGRNNTAGSGHALYEDGGIPRQVLAQIRSNDAAVEVVAAAGPAADEELDLPSGIELLDGSGRILTSD